MTGRKVKRYSIGFKRQVVEEYEAGISISYLKKKYRITGNGTIERWIGKYGCEGLRNKMMVIQTPDEQQYVKELEEKVKRLESLVANLSLDKVMLESLVEVADETYGLGLKKSYVNKRSTKAKQKG